MSVDIMIFVLKPSKLRKPSIWPSYDIVGHTQIRTLYLDMIYLIPRICEFLLYYYLEYKTNFFWTILTRQDMTFTNLRRLY
jgi:hypothetical protein